MSGRIGSAVTRAFGVLALAVVKEIDARAQSDIAAAERLLASHWERIEPHVMALTLGSGLSPADRLAAVVLHEYFCHRGDWCAIKRCLLTTFRAAGLDEADLEAASDASARSLADRRRASKRP